MGVNGKEEREERIEIFQLLLFALYHVFSCFSINTCTKVPSLVKSVWGVSNLYLAIIKLLFFEK